MFSRIVPSRLLNCVVYLGTFVISARFANAQLLPIPDESGFALDPGRSAVASKLAWIAFGLILLGIVVSVVIVAKAVMGKIAKVTSKPRSWPVRLEFFSSYLSMATLLVIVHDVFLFAEHPDRTQSFFQ